MGRTPKVAGKRRKNGPTTAADEASDSEHLDGAKDRCWHSNLDERQQGPVCIDEGNVRFVKQHKYCFPNDNSLLGSVLWIAADWDRRLTNKNRLTTTVWAV